MSWTSRGLRPNNDVFKRIEQENRAKVERTQYFQKGEFTVDLVGGTLGLNASQTRSFLEKGLRDGWVIKADAGSGRRIYKKPSPNILVVPWTKKELQRVLTPAND